MLDINPDLLPFQGYFSVIDPIDSDLTNHKWYKSTYGYAARSENYHQFMLHRVIMMRILGRNLQHNEMVDHIDGNRWNNRRSNLRVTTSKGNTKNKQARSTSKSGYKHVCWNESYQKWVVEISVEGKNITSGLFVNVIEAARYADELMIKYHGQYARLNFPEEHGIRVYTFEEILKDAIILDLRPPEKRQPIYNNDGTITIFLGKEKSCIIENKHADLAGYQWSALTENNYFAAIRTYYDSTGAKKTLRLHREILERKIGRELESGEIADHIDGDPSNCREDNLRIADSQQNRRNSKQYNSTGYKGVTYHEKQNKYRARIGLDNGKRLHLGYYVDPESAARAYDLAALRYFGEYARLNFPDLRDDYLAQLKSE